jgi:hypothetical protein
MARSSERERVECVGDRAFAALAAQLLGHGAKIGRVRARRVPRASLDGDLREIDEGHALAPRVDLGTRQNEPPAEGRPIWSVACNRPTP